MNEVCVWGVGVDVGRWVVGECVRARVRVRARALWLSETATILLFTPGALETNHFAPYILVLRVAK